MFVEAEVWNVAHTDQGYAVLIKPLGTDAAVPIFVGQLEAQSILIGMGDIPMPRPNTHDLFLQGISKTGSTLKKVEISEIKDGIFYSTIYLDNMGNAVTLDSRPSDSIAIAVRADCPIFIAEEIIDEAGVSIHFITEKTDEANSEAENRKIELEKALEDAIKLEHYEEAAILRDQIKKLNEEIF
ncbi:MAG: bifunctional nuclease family protein [Spirochaetales bacterium]|nr:bifunctional nuclease family protein [Spirochaetales bacterium]